MCFTKVLHLQPWIAFILSFRVRLYDSIISKILSPRRENFFAEFIALFDTVVAIAKFIKIRYTTGS